MAYLIIPVKAINIIVFKVLFLFIRVAQTLVLEIKAKWLNTDF